MDAVTQVQFEQIDITGCRLVGAMTKLGHVGPKHHGIVIGRGFLDRKTYVAENNHDGYRLVTYEQFLERYSENDKIHIFPNEGEFSDEEVARRALTEISSGGAGTYDLALNNCESFSNRAMHGHSKSTQVINTFVGLAIPTRQPPEMRPTLWTGTLYASIPGHSTGPPFCWWKSPTPTISRHLPAPCAVRSFTP
jgi:hypothetical protein